MDQDKPTFRSQFFKDLYRTTLLVTSGAVVSSVTFIENLQTKIVAKPLFFAGFTFLVLSIVFQMFIPLLNVMASNHYWHAVQEGNEEAGIQSDKIGKRSGKLIITSIVCTMIGVVLLAIFAGVNI